MQKRWLKSLVQIAYSFEEKKLSSIIDWFENNYNLPDVGVIKGLYDFYYTPYFLGVANALESKSVDEVVLVKAAQIGWTYFIIGVTLKQIDEKPCPIMGLFAKTGDGKSFHDEKLIPTIKANPVISNKVDVTTSRKSGNRWDLKNFSKGFLKLVGSNSPGNVKSTSSVGFAFIEEPDDTSDNVKDQGDSIGNLEERLKRYPNSTLATGGTPAIKGLSKIEYRLSCTDEHVFPVVCHDCNESHILDFSNVKWLKDEAVNHPVYGTNLFETAEYSCPHCGSLWDDNQRQSNIRSTAYDAFHSGDKKSGWVGPGDFTGKVGFNKLSEMYSCLPGAGLSVMVEDFLKAKRKSDQGDESLMIKFINQKLGQGYEFKGEQTNANELREVSLDYPENIIPKGGLILTIGVDVQPDRLAIIKRVWGREEESWNILWKEVSANVSVHDVKDPVWAELDKEIFSPVKGESGIQLLPSAISIDSSDGNTNAAVYHWVRTRTKKYPKIQIMAIKGSSSQQDPEIFATPSSKSIDHKNPKKQTKADRWGLKIYLVGTNKAKDLISGLLQLEVKYKDQPGKGIYHFYKNIRADYCDQITGEIKAPHKSIRNRKVWQQKSGQNVEALDGEVYALHAARAVRVHLKSEAQWHSIENNLTQIDLFSERERDTPKKAEKPVDNKQSNNKWIDDNDGDWI